MVIDPGPVEDEYSKEERLQMKELEKQHDQELLDTLENEMDIWDLNFPPMLFNALYSNNIRYVFQLEKYTAKELKRIKNIGDKSISEIESKLIPLGKRLAVKSNEIEIDKIKGIKENFIVFYSSPRTEFNCNLLNNEIELKHFFKYCDIKIKKILKIISVKDVTEEYKEY